MATVTKHRGKWVVDYRDTAGRRHILRKGKDGITFRTRKGADDAFADMIKSGRKPETKITFREYGKWWLQHCAKDQIKESTFDEYEAVLENHLYPTFGECLMSRITRMEAREFITNEKQGGRRISEIRRLEQENGYRAQPIAIQRLLNSCARCNLVSFNISKQRKKNCRARPCATCWRQHDRCLTRPLKMGFSPLIRSQT